jgi:hypothetical protein
MTTHTTPRARHFSDFDAYADAMAHAAIADLPAATNYDDYAERRAKRDAIRAAINAAEDLARDRWERHVEHMEDLYERGVGPAWEGMV